MGKLIEISTYHQNEGLLSVIEYPLLPAMVKRVFWIYQNSPDAVRGRHRHKKSAHLLVCASGSCKVYTNNGRQENTFSLNSPEQVLYLEPSDWREMYDFSKECVLFCLSDQLYDPEDYICTPYESDPALLNKNQTV